MYWQHCHQDPILTGLNRPRAICLYGYFEQFVLR